MSDLTLGQRIAEQRKKLGISQEALGEKMGVSRQAISKWEADGAIPEIDKLIGLSRLFDISVGWLLGVEEQTDQRHDELNETQLKMVEEIVKRYQPTDQKPKRPWYVPVLNCLTAITAIIAIASVVNPNSAPNQNYDGQISALEANYASIQRQLSDLDNRLGDLTEAAEASAKLLLRYDMELTEITPGSTDSEIIKTGPNSSDIILDLPSADIAFTAVPKQYTQSDTAYLAVLLNGHPLQEAECIWQGSAYAADITLSVFDGYEYRFILQHQDGTRDIQVLDLEAYADLWTNTRIHCSVPDFVTAEYNPQAHTLDVGSFITGADMPRLGTGTESVRWVDFGVVLYRNGEELERRSEFSGGLFTEEDRLVTGFTIDSISMNFHNVKLEEGDRLELCLHASLSNGMTEERTLGSWTMLGGVLTATADES